MDALEFFTLVQSTGEREREKKAEQPAPRTSRDYEAFTRSATAEHFITLHSDGGKVDAFPYSGVQHLNSDRSETYIRLQFAKTFITLKGRQLAPVLEALRTRTAAHIRLFEYDRHDPPTPGEPVIMEMVAQQPKPAAAAAVDA